MKKVFPSICCCGFAALFLSGCVGQGAYEKKSQEASTLTREANLLKREKTEISRENDELRMELAATGRKISQLENSKKKLEETLSSGTDRTSQRLIELEKENNRLKAEIDSVIRGREEDARGASRLYENLIERMKDDIARGFVKLAELRGRVTITVDGAVLFEDGKDCLKPSGADLLKKIAGIHKELGVREIQITSTFVTAQARDESGGSRGGTWYLNSGRAAAVARLLGENGFDPSDIITTVTGRLAFPGAGKNSALTETACPIEIVAIVKE